MQLSKILFLCVGNMCRSPMAEALARFHGGAKVDVHSAGLAATGRVAQGTLEVLREKGISIDGLSSKPVWEVDVASMDVIISLLGDPGLRVLPRHLPARRVSWDIPDPIGQPVDRYRETFELLEPMIVELLREIEEELPIVMV